MGKRKRPQNIVKIDLGEDVFGKGEVLPAPVQQSSKDGRCVEQTIHKIRTPQEKPPAPTFDPSPMYGATEHCAYPEVHDQMNESNDPERICPNFSL